MLDDTPHRGPRSEDGERVEDSELLRRYTDEKSEDAFAELVRRHIDLVHAVALRKVGGDAPLAEDVAQRVFTAVARKAPMLSGHPAFIGWLFTTTHFAATQLVRAERRRQAREQRAHMMKEMASDNGTAVDWERLRPTLDDLIGELDERDREAVLLRFFEGRSLREVGAKIRLTEEGARSRVDRALAKLEERLTRRGITSTSSALAIALANQVGAAAPAGLAASVTGVALAGGAAGVGGVVGIFTFMSTTKMVASIAGVAVLLALGTTVFEFNAVRESESALASASRERDELRGRLAGLEQRTMRAEESRAAMQVELERGWGREGKSATADAARKSVRATGSLNEYVLEHPEAQSAYLERAALTAKARFDRFFRAANLTSEQQDRFLKTIMEDADGRLDTLALLRAAGGLDPNGPRLEAATMEQMETRQKQHDTNTTNALRELLGDQYKPLMHYMTTLAERNVVDQLAGKLYDTEAPLTAQQAEQLTQILAQNVFRPQASPSPTNSMGEKFIPREVFNAASRQAMQQDLPWMQTALVTDAAVARAGGTLTSGQIAALKLLQSQQAAQLQFVELVKSKDDAAGKTK